MNPSQVISEFLKLLTCAFAVAAVAMTITRAVITAPLRKWVKSKSEWLGELVSCPYCASHWGSLIAVLIFKPRPVVTPWPAMDFTLSAFAMVGLAAVCAWIIFQVYKSLPPVAE